MQKNMKHPKHGEKLVYLDDIVQMEKEGWSVGEVEEEVETPEDAYEKKFGKKPHHKMKLENIIAALEE